MNWVTALCDLYEKNESLAGKYKDNNDSDKKPLMLLPLSHVTVLAQIEVSINGQGEFLRAVKLSKEEALTLIPVTESSAIRTSGQAPHPLMDTLQYVAGDYDKYTSTNMDEDTGKSKSVSYHGRYEEYISNLEDWCESEYAHPKAISVLRYLKKACLMEDLIREQVLLVDEDGLLLAETKIQSVVQGKAFIRFRVETGEVPDFMDESGKYFAEIWKDTTLQKSYIEYAQNQPANIGLCYLSGITGPITNSFPKKIRHDGDSTKMLSSNDNSGFTFRGRFANNVEAFSIGYETSQKAHNALNWIIRKQGYLRNGLCVVTWESDLKPFVSIFADAADAIYQAMEDDVYGGGGGGSEGGGGGSGGVGDSGGVGGSGSSSESNSGSVEYGGGKGSEDASGGGEGVDYSDDYDDGVDEMQFQQDTNRVTADHFNQALKGYMQNVKNTSNMVVMALDAATQGRLAITYFNQLPYSRYIENIAFWHESCCWRHAKFLNKRLIFFEGMASLNEIALALYGSEQENFLKLRTDPDGKAPMLVSTFQRLSPCILERRNIPKDLAHVAIARASSPLAYEKNNWRRILSIACSIVKKTKYDWEGENWSMALDHDCTDRSYLYGRLLAVADRAEEATFDKEEEKRETNAMRYMNAFSRRPFRTWQVIEERLRPYFSKLPKGSQIHYKKLLNEIQDLFIIEQFSNDSALDGLYLLGYHSQISELFTKKDSAATEDEMDANNNEINEGGDE